MNLNKVFVLGHITHPPELRTTQSGQPVLTMGVATNRAWTDKNGQKQEGTEFHTIVAWGKLAESASAFLTKGSLVLVEGRLETRTWTDKDGVSRKATQITAEGMQFGPKPAGVKVEAPQAPKSASEPVIQLDGDEEDTGKQMAPLFPDDEIRPEDIPF